MAQGGVENLNECGNFEDEENLVVGNSYSGKESMTASPPIKILEQLPSLNLNELSKLLEETHTCMEKGGVGGRECPTSMYFIH